jgi:hypothetical protein
MMMKIGIDAYAMQYPAYQGRGIGRFSRDLVTALLTRGSGVEFIIYAHDEWPTDRLPAAPNARIVAVGANRAIDLKSRSDRMEQLALYNPDDLDLLLFLSPFEMDRDYRLAAKPLNNLKMASIVYDLIIFLHPERYLADPAL